VSASKEIETEKVSELFPPKKNKERKKVKVSELFPPKKIPSASRHTCKKRAMLVIISPPIFFGFSAKFRDF